VFYRYRAWGARNVPRAGPVLLLSNHQSYLDPVLVGIAGHRRQFYAMARSTLFRNWAFGWLIRSINAIPVQRGQADMQAMRRSIDTLKRGQALLLFPEGTRTTDGTTKPFAKGTMILIKRAKPIVVPVAVEGAYDVWPKGRRAPKLRGKTSVAFGLPIEPEKLLEMGDEQGLEHVRGQIEQMRLDLARKRS